MTQDKTYPGGYDALLRRANLRREPLVFAEDESLPDLNTDLTALCTSITVAEPLTSESTFAKKRRDLQLELEGEPELCFLNSLTIATLRKNEFPPHAPELFQKIWREHSEFLLRRLPLRWLVSTITTFGDHGLTEAQRHVGRSMTMLFGMIKLYEFERLYSGYAPATAYDTASKINTRLPLDIPSYSLKGGGLDVALLTRLWKDAQQDPVIKPLANHLLNAINDDPNTLFRRLRNMADQRVQHLEENNKNPIPVPQRHVKRDPSAISWGIVATLNDDHDQAVRFVAHHVTLGADQIVLYADDPQDVPHELGLHPNVTVITCDETVISNDQRESLPLRNARKAYYFNKARRKLRLDWVAMLDVDEFLLPKVPVREILAKVPEDAAFLALSVVEQFADAPTLFRPPASAYDLPQEHHQELFPTFGSYVPDLVLGPSEGRLVVRGKLGNIRVGNFVVKYEKRAATNSYTLPDMIVAHCHSEDYPSFLAALPRRIAEGYTRRKPDGTNIKSVLDAVDYKSQNAELKAMFQEICSARPEVIEMLKSQGVLLEHNLDLDRKIDQFIADVTP
ncbi:hypothetical protein NBRC116601_05930 [Cognatishimia sp. WU-CL00825]|uniref:glycosyltransferase family 2 protein n=1 Tax=Cognatishimia sp. WU-CL00825 TaxID=3127658 RepID=UPI00310BE2BB